MPEATRWTSPGGTSRTTIRAAPTGRTWPTYMAEHPNVNIEITVMENEAFKAAIQTNIQSGDVPDLFQSWGGGALRDQVAAGVVRDITSESADMVGDLSAAATGLYQVDGKQYGIPFDAGMVGIWYNEDLFSQAGIDGPPATWDELLSDVQLLKDAGITPIAVGAGDKWPAHFWYSHLMVRMCGAAEMTAMASDGDFSRDCVVKAGQMVGDLVALDPFQEGFLGAGWDAPDGESGTMASQGAAMDLMGQWAPGAFRNQAGITDASQPLPFALGWTPFPSVQGGAGDPADALGGGNGFAVGKDAPPEAVDFLAFITNAQNQRTWAQNSGLPVNVAASDAVSDPNMQAVLAGLNEAPFLQLFLDQFFTAEIGATVNDQTALLFAGATSPEDAAAAITSVAQG
ncbi:MAG: extracellular solute-binding protein [Ilumatobacteraceae bacterium]